MNFELTFVNPCMSAHNSSLASKTSGEWLQAHKRFNASYNGVSLILTAIDNPNDRLITSEVINVQRRSNAEVKIETRNSMIFIWDCGVAQPYNESVPFATVRNLIGPNGRETVLRFRDKTDEEPGDWRFPRLAKVGDGECLQCSIEFRVDDTVVVTTADSTTTYHHFGPWTKVVHPCTELFEDRPEGPWVKKAEWRGDYWEVTTHETFFVMSDYHKSSDDIYVGQVTFDQAFHDAVQDAQRECFSAGEFAFAWRKSFRKRMIDTLGGADRDRRDFVRWALKSR